MNQIFWNSYRRLEKEVIALSDVIHFSDDQLKVYSSRIADLLVRTAIEVESLAKVLYFDIGGTQPADRDLYFDTDCIKLLEDKWQLSKKTVFVNTPFFYFEKDENQLLKPLHKASKRGSSSSRWQQAYQAVKHDRINNLKCGNIGNLILALSALYILNIYYRDAKFESVVDKDASNIDWGLGSEIFAVKISRESDGVADDQIYVKKADYDECIYLVKHTDKTAQAFIDVMSGVNKQIRDQTMNDVVQTINAKIKAGVLGSDADAVTAQAHALYKEKNSAAMRRVLAKEGSSIHKALQGLRFEAVLNKHQY